MSKSILVAGSEKRFDCILLMLGGGGLLVFFTMAPGRDAALSYSMQAVGGIMLIAGLILLTRRRSSRLWATDLDDRLELTDGRTPRIIADDTIGAAAYVLGPTSGIDDAQSQTRTLRIRAAGPEGLEDIKLSTEFPIGSPDPLGPYIERIVRRLSTAADAVLQRGGSFPGDGWTLASQELRLTHEGATVSVPVRDISSVSVLDKKVCIWRGDDESPTYRLPQDGWNNVVLADLLVRRIPPETEAKFAARAGSSNLGRLLYERRAGAGTIRFYFISAILLGIGSIVLLGFLLMSDGKQQVDLSFAAFGTFAAALACGYGALASKRNSFQCFESGIRRYGIRSEQTLRFEDVEAFTFQATRMYHNGVYTGTTYVLDFEPPAGSEARRLRYSTTIRNADEMLQTLREHIAQMIGSRMARGALAGGRIPWTPNIWFDGGRLYYVPTGLFKSKETASVPIEEVDQYRFDDGVLSVFVRSGGKAFLTAQTSERNFFPGLTCLLMLVNYRPDAEEPASSTSPPADVTNRS